MLFFLLWQALSKVPWYGSSHEANSFKSTTYPVWVCTKSVQQELILVSEQGGKHHHAQAVSPLSQLCRLRGVVEVVIGHQQRFVRADGCCIAADISQPVDNIALLQYAGLCSTQLLDQRHSRPSAQRQLSMKCCCTCFSMLNGQMASILCCTSVDEASRCALLATCICRSSSVCQHP